jgi:hypothetical protein
LRQVGEEFASTAIARQMFLNQVAADDASTRFMEGSHKLLFGDPSAGTNPVTGDPNQPGYYAMRGADAIKAGPPTAQLDALAQSIAASLPNDRARLEFNTETRRQRSFIDAELGRHWDQQLQVYGKQSQAALTDQATRQAALYHDDPAQLANAIDMGRKAAVRTAQLEYGMDADPAIIGDAIAKSDALIVGSAIEAKLAANNPAGAKAMLDAHRDVFTGPQQEAYTKAIQPHLDRQIGEQAADRAWRDAGGPGGQGGFTAPPGPPIPGATPYEQQTLDEIRHREAPGGYASGGPFARGEAHTGAYQFADSTWQEAAQATGQGTQYKQAKDAPPAVQDANALWLLRNRGTAPWAETGPYPAPGGRGTRVAAAAPTTATDATAPPAPAGPGTPLIPGTETPAVPPPGRPLITARGTIEAPSDTAVPAAATPSGVLPSREDLLSRIPADLTPEQHDAAVNAINRKYNRYQQSTEESRARLRDSLNNGLQMLADGRPFDYDPAQVRALLPPEQADVALQKLDDAKVAGQAMVAVRGMTPAEIAAKQAELRAGLETGPTTGYTKRKQEAAAFDAAVTKQRTGLKEDPATWVATYNPAIAAQQAASTQSPAAFEQYATATLAEQERLGVLPAATHVLGTTQAQGIVQRIMANPETAPQAMKQLQAQSGAAWPLLWHDLVTTGKMPAAYQAVGALDNEADGNLLARALGETAKSEKTWETILPSTARHDIRTAIEGDSGVNNLFLSLVRSGASGEQIAGIKGAIETLAYAKHFYQQDASRSAAEHAARSFTDKYEFMPNGGARVPAPVFNTVATNAAQRLAGLETGGIMVPQALTQTPAIPGAATPDDYMRVLKANPTWVTSPKADGIRLMDPQGRLVKYRDGTPVTVRFDEPPLSSATAPGAGVPPMALPPPGG